MLAPIPQDAVPDRLDIRPVLHDVLHAATLLFVRVDSHAHAHKSAHCS